MKESLTGIQRETSVTTRSDHGDQEATSLTRSAASGHAGGGRLPTPAVVLLVMALSLAAFRPAPVLATEPLPDTDVLRRWVAEMKDAPRGPFKQLRWFCNDGTVLPPKEGCSRHGGGVQHGQWNDRVVAMREGGYAIGNVLADLEAKAFVGPDADLFTLYQILVERFLITADDGWIFRAARSYRGALQAEDEEAGSRRVVSAVLEDPSWRGDPRFFPLREVVRLLPYRLGSDSAAATEVRQLAKVIADKDPDFEHLRVKIHGVPDAGDAERVREYARNRGKAALADQYERLAQDIDAMYQSRRAAEDVRKLAGSLEDKGLRDRLLEHAGNLARAGDAPARFAEASYLVAMLRLNAEKWPGADRGLGLIETSLALEAEIYSSGNTVLTRTDEAERRELLHLLGHAANALYGAGFITKRHLDGVAQTVNRLTREENPSLQSYREELRYLARVPEWAGRTLVLHFSEPVDHLTRIEPLAAMYPQDRLRGSPVLFYGAVIDSLVKDANRLAGVEHDLFGQPTGAGLRALNPGLVRGVLRVPTSLEHTHDFDPKGIYLLPETVSHLPPVAGILTQGEGSSLSHVQLLARNLGIPNVVVGETLLPKVRKHDGRPVVLAVSPGGVVQLSEDGPRWDQVFGREGPPADLEIRPDLNKLDLSATDFITLNELRAKDSGRTAGPKSANLGELKHHFGDAVPPGVVIPFGAFRKLLDRPLETGGPSVFEWMRERYRTIAALKGSPRKQQQTVREFLARLRSWIENVDPGPGFRNGLRSALQTNFGADGSYGVFVRSDTNVEDLPGFTGAGLNLTVPNVVGFDSILRAIREVWASPFTERSYSWRQAHMTDPEYVFPAVLLQLAFPSDKSGVMVTADVESGRYGWLSVAVNEGVGGAVDGQAAESLLVSSETGKARFLAQATAPKRRKLLSSGGLTRVPTSGTEAVLEDGEIAQLVALAKEVPRRFPELRDDSGKPAPADIEFAFRNGRLTLLQMRPFVESSSAQRSQYLSELDARSRERGSMVLRLDAVPEVDR